MIDPITLFREGGPFMYLLLLVSPVAVLGSCTPLLAALLKRRIPTAVPLAFVLLPSLIGVLGWLQGMGLVAGAVVHASPEMASKLAAMGMSVNLFTVIAGTGLTGLLAFLASSLGLAASFMAHREAEHTAATQASRRSGALLFAGMGFAGLGSAWVAMRTAMFWNAEAVASAEMAGALKAAAMEGVTTGALLAVVASAMFLLGALVHALAVPASRTPRTAIGAGVGALLCLPTLALPLVQLDTAMRMAELATPWRERRAEFLIQSPIDLPTAELTNPFFGPANTVRWTGAPGPMHDIHGPIDALPTGDQRSRVRVEAVGSTPLTDLWEALGPALDATVRTPEGELASLWIGQATQPPRRGDVVLVPDGDLVTVFQAGDGVFEPLSRGPMRELRSQLERFPFTEGQVHIGEGFTLDDVAALHARVGPCEAEYRRSQGPCALTFTTAEPPPWPDEPPL